MTTYSFDPAHASASFSARHMMVTTVRGSFTKVSGKLEFDPANPAASYVEAEIDTRSMTTTGVEQRDQHLQSPDFLDVANYPTITFKSTKVEPNADGTQAKVTGDLTIRGVTRPVTLDVEFLGEGVTPYGNKIAGWAATTKINREDFGLTWNMALETGGWLVGKEVKIELDVETILVTEQQPA